MSGKRVEQRARVPDPFGALKVTTPGCGEKLVGRRLTVGQETGSCPSFRLLSDSEFVKVHCHQVLAGKCQQCPARFYLSGLVSLFQAWPGAESGSLELKGHT